MVVLPGFGTISRTIGLVVVVAAMGFLCKKQGIRTLGPVQCLFVVYLIWIMASFFWSVDLEGSKDSISIYVKQGVFLWIIWEFSQSENHQIQLMKAYILGAFIPIISIITAFLQGAQSSYFRYSAAGFDPNDIGLTIALAIPMAWYIVTATQKKIFIWICSFYVPLAFIAIILTASRAAFVALMVALVFVVSGIPKLSMLKKSLFLVLILLSGFLVAKFVPAYSWDRLLTIGSQVSEGDVGSRVNIWRGGIEVFADHPLMGTGIGSFRTSFESYFGIWMSPHNLFLSVMVDLGLIGLCLFLAIVAAALYGTKHMDTLKRKMWIFIFLTWFVGVMTLGWAHRKPTWFLIGLLSVQGAVQVKKQEEINGVAPNSLPEIPG